MVVMIWINRLGLPYLLQFKSYAMVQSCIPGKEMWTTQLRTLLLGLALEVYSKLLQEEAIGYKSLQ